MATNNSSILDSYRSKGKRFNVKLTRSEIKELKAATMAVVKPRVRYPITVGLAMESVFDAKKVAGTHVIVAPRAELKVLDRIIRIYIDKKKKMSPVTLVTVLWKLHYAVKGGGR